MQQRSTTSFAALFACLVFIFLASAQPQPQAPVAEQQLPSRVHGALNSGQLKAAAQGKGAVRFGRGSAAYADARNQIPLLPKQGQQAAVKARHSVQQSASRKLNQWLTGLPLTSKAAKPCVGCTVGPGSNLASTKAPRVSLDQINASEDHTGYASNGNRRSGSRRLLSFEIQDAAQDFRRLHTVPSPGPKPSHALPPISISGLALPPTPKTGASINLNQIISPFGINLGDLGNSITIPSSLPSIASKSPVSLKPAGSPQPALPVPAPAPGQPHNKNQPKSVKLADLFVNNGTGGGGAG